MLQNYYKQVRERILCVICDHSPWYLEFGIVICLKILSVLSFSFNQVRGCEGEVVRSSTGIPL